MPFGDGTGPQGQGPMSGRGLGRCSGSNSPGYTQQKPGCGRGRGFRNWFQSTGLFGWQRAKRNMPAWGRTQTENSPEQEKQALKTELENLHNQAERIEQRLQDLEGSE